MVLALISLDVNELSLNAGGIQRMKSIVRKADLPKARELAQSFFEGQ